MTKDLNESERRLIRQSNLSHAALAKIFFITESQVRYIRSSEGKRAQRARSVWDGNEEERLMRLYDEHGWKPRLIAESFPYKTYSQVYRKLTREIKGR